MQKQIPMLFSTAMVKAILADRKTQTLRTSGLGFINEEPGEWKPEIWDNSDEKWTKQLTGRKHVDFSFFKGYEDEVFYAKCPYGKPGDVIWVRESWCNYSQAGNDGAAGLIFKAGNETLQTKWKPSIHMPKEAARIWLQVESIGVERLQDISVNDAANEGVEYWNVDAEAFEGGELIADYRNYMWRDDESYEDYYFPSYADAISSFKSLWQSINGEESWNSNPWVWVVGFKVLSTTGKPADLKGE